MKKFSTEAFLKGGIFEGGVFVRLSVRPSVQQSKYCPCSTVKFDVVIVKFDVEFNVEGTNFILLDILVWTW